MHKIIQLLQSDHSNIKKLLVLLEQQLKQFAQGDTPDFNMMQDILTYLANVEEKLHYPIEEYIVKKTKKNYPDTGKVIQSMHSEHEKLVRQTVGFVNTLNEIILDAMIPRENVLKEGRAFIRSNLHNIEQESDILFPMFEQVLQQQDWLDIENKVYDAKTPLYDPILKKQYQDLFNSIVGETPLSSQK